jgi:ATP-dependent Zn protease
LGNLTQKIVFPAVLFAGLLLLSRNSSGAGGVMEDQNPMGFGKSKAEIQMIPGDTGVTFDDVAGCHGGAKLELAEVVDFSEADRDLHQYGGLPYSLWVHP